MKNTRGMVPNSGQEKVLWSKKWFYIAAVLLFSLILGSVFALKGNEESTSILTKEKKGKGKTYEHTFPKRVSKNDFFKGEFVLNDVASVYPRRNAIVRDILVDIGDEVKSGETLAILFEPGVQGESNAKINVKSTFLQTKDNLLEEALKVKQAKISEIEQKIVEKKLILEKTEKSFDTQIKQVGNKDENDLFGTEYKVQEKNLQILQKNLENAKGSYTDLVNNAQSNIEQKKDLFYAKISEVFLDMIPMLYIGSEAKLDYDNISTSDISFLFGAKNTQVRDELIIKINDFKKSKDELNLDQKYEMITNIQDLFILNFKNTPISTTTPQATISTYIGNIDTFYSTLISQKELYDDAINELSILEASQKEKIENIEEQIGKQEDTLALLESKSLLIEDNKDLAVQKILSEIATLEKSRDLLIANEDKNITSIENQLQIAKADLNKEYVNAGDYKIISPFSGIVSKRNVQIGEQISPSMEVFRITGVETTLAKITKKEVKFYVPENLKENLKLEKEINFFFADDKQKSFSGSIYRISPEIDEKTFSITVQARVSDEINLSNKSTVRVSLENKEDVFKVPTSAIYNKEERKIIYYKKDNGKLGVKDVTIVSDDGEYSLVTGNFNETLKVVTTPIFIK